MTREEMIDESVIRALPMSVIRSMKLTANPYNPDRIWLHYWRREISEIRTIFRRISNREATNGKS